MHHVFHFFGCVFVMKHLLLQIFISIVCAAITTPPIMFLVYIFQHTKRRKQNEDDHRKRSRCCGKQRSTSDRDRLREIMLSSEVPQLNGRLQFPFWYAQSVIVLLQLADVLLLCCHTLRKT